LTRHAAQPAPEPSKRKRKDQGEAGRGFAFRKAKRQLTRRKPAPPPQSAPDFARATLYLADTLDWLNLWQDNAASFADEPTQTLDFPALRF
jgi:hypothetical protein